MKVKVNSRKFDQSINRSWDCQLLKHSGNNLELLGTFERDVEHSDLGRIQKGTLSVEHFWLDRWYNAFYFFEPNGEFRNFYFNITMPPHFSDGVLDYVDLDIDVLVWPDGDVQILDQEEFEQNAISYKYPPTVLSNSSTALSEVLKMVQQGEFCVPAKLLQQKRLVGVISSEITI